MIYIEPSVYEELDAMTTNLRAIVSSRSVPEPVLSGLRLAFRELLSAMRDTHPDPNHEHRIHTQPDFPLDVA